MKRKYHIIAVAVLVLCPIGVLADDGLPGPGASYFDAPYRPMLALRYGWWVVATDGELAKVGEYQDLDSGPFADVDALFSDGVRSVDLFATSTDAEGTQAHFDYFGPHLQADIDFQQFLHRLDHDPLDNMGVLESGEEIVREDLNAGEDYAIRVEELKTSFKGKLTKNIKMRVNFRVLHKQGQRQANAVQHCFGGVPQQGPLPDNNCHVLSQRQRIDWTTVRLEPVIEADFGPIRAEYSRPMRFFSQSDQVVVRDFGLHNPTDRPYAFVPENFTQVDRLKLGADLGANSRFYGRLQYGDTQNRFRRTHRTFYGFDLRLTNQTFDRVTLTGYATLNEQRNQNVPFLLPEEEAALAVPTSLVPPYGIRRPIDYFRRSVGADATWRPFQEGHSLRGLSLTLGTEQGVLERDHAQYVIQDLANPPGPVVDQQRTVYTLVNASTSLRWSPTLDTFVRYKVRATEDPLFAVNRYYGYTNTSLPQQENLAEVGGTWTPATNFLTTVSVGFQNRQHHSDIANFEEDDYPMTFTLWYAPTPKWSLSAGYGFYSNWIDQDITFPSDTPDVSVGDTRRFSYGGRGRVLSVGGSHAWTRQLTLSGGVQLVWARDAMNPLEPWPDLAGYSDVIVNRARVTGGVDWHPRDRIAAYFRYIWEDYDDQSATYNSGTAHMLLTGLTATF